MRENLFADAFYFIAVVNHRDEHHEVAIEASAEFYNCQFWTTEWALVELADACCASPFHRAEAAEWIRSILAGEMIVVMVTPDLFSRALAFYERHSDKQWSLTDCLSFVVMRDNGITKALTGDRHFVQAGFDALIL